MPRGVQRAAYSRLRKKARAKGNTGNVGLLSSIKAKWKARYRAYKHPTPGCCSSVGPADMRMFTTTSVGAMLLTTATAVPQQASVALLDNSAAGASNLIHYPARYDD